MEPEWNPKILTMVFKDWILDDKSALFLPNPHCWAFAEVVVRKSDVVQSQSIVHVLKVDNARSWSLFWYVNIAIDIVSQFSIVEILKPMQFWSNGAIVEHVSILEIVCE